MNSLDKKMKLRMNKERKPIPMNELAHSLINSDERIPIQEEKRERLRFRLSSNLISLFTQIRIRLAHRYAHSSSWSPRGSRSLMRIRKLTGRRASNQCAGNSSQSSANPGGRVSGWIYFNGKKDMNMRFSFVELDGIQPAFLCLIARPSSLSVLGVVFLLGFYENSGDLRPNLDTSHP